MSALLGWQSCRVRVVGPAGRLLPFCFGFCIRPSAVWRGGGLFVLCCLFLYTSNHSLLVVGSVRQDSALSCLLVYPLWLNSHVQFITRLRLFRFHLLSAQAA